METKKISDQLEMIRRIRIVADWVLQDHLSADIISYCVSKWGVSERQGYRYLEAALDELKEKSERSLEQKKAYYISRKRKLIRDMDPGEKKTAAGVAAIDKVLNGMAKLEGIQFNTLKLVGDPDQPITTELRANIAHHHIDYTKLPTEFLRQLIASRVINK